MKTDSRFMSAITNVIDVLCSYYSNSNAGVFVTAVFEDLSDHSLSHAVSEVAKNKKTRRLKEKEAKTANTAVVICVVET